MKQNKHTEKESKRIQTNRLAFLPSLFTISETEDNDCFKLKYAKSEEKIVGVALISGVDIFSFDDDDKLQTFDNFAKATLSLRLPHKYVFTNTIPNLQSQKDFIAYKYNQNSNEYHRYLLERQYNVMELLEEKSRDRNAYLFVYGKNTDEVNNALAHFTALMQDVSISRVKGYNLKTVLYKLMSFEDSPSEEIIKDSLQNIVFRNNVSYSNTYAKVGDTYFTSLVINKFPSHISPLTFASLFNSIGDANVLMDVNLNSNNDILDDLKASMKELDSRSSITMDNSQVHDTMAEYEDIESLYTEISRGHERVTSLSLRIIVYDNSLSGLMKKVEDVTLVTDSLDLSSYCPEFSMKKEYSGFLIPHNDIKTPFPLHNTYKGQFPFYYQSQIDPNGTYFGKTYTDGLAMLDFFLKNDNRISYDLLLAGIKGSGKTVTLKSLVQDYNVLNNKIMVLDIENEFKRLANKLGGIVVNMNKNSLINPLQLNTSIVVTAEEDDDSQEYDLKLGQNAVNFASEISRILTFMHQYIPELSAFEDDVFEDILLEVYASKGITEETDISTLKNTDFPIFSDVLQLIRNKLYLKNGQVRTDLSKNKFNALEKLELHIKRLAEGAYASMFNGYTQIRFSDENLIVFNVKALSEMEERIYNAQLFQILSLMWTETCKNVSYNENIINPYERRHVISVIDEAHRFINANNEQSTSFINKLVRRSRKYDAGLWFASQDITDFVPEENTVGAENVKAIFNMVQYKLILKQDHSAAEILHSIFPQFTYSELKSTSGFIPGEMLLSLGSGHEKIHCFKEVADEDLLYMGSSRDREKLSKEVNTSA